MVSRLEETEVDTADPRLKPFVSLKRSHYQFRVVRDRLSGMSLTCVAKKHRISRTSVCRLMKEAACGPQIDVISSQDDHRPVGQQVDLERVA
jgi:hypothetical protein